MTGWVMAGWGCTVAMWFVVAGAGEAALAWPRSAAVLDRVARVALVVECAVAAAMAAVVLVWMVAT